MKRYEYSSSAGAGIGLLTTNWTPTNAGIPRIQHLLYDDQEGNANSFGSADQASFTQSGGAVELNTMDSAPVYYTTVTEYFEDAGRIQLKTVEMFTPLTSILIQFSMLLLIRQE